MQTDSITLRRLAAQLLTYPAPRTPVEITCHLLAVQAQAPRGARLSLRARSQELCVADIERALTTERSLLITWLNRGTLQLVCSEDFHWLHALTTPQLRTGNARRLIQEGVPSDAADAGVKVIEHALLSGPVTRGQLRDRLDAAGIPTRGQALVHLLARSAISGSTVRGPMVGNEQAFVLSQDWIGPGTKVDREQAIAELARRFLRAHGPADERDLARWAGITLKDARLGLAAISAEINEVGGGLVDLAGREPVETVPAPRLLGPYDPTLLGWTSRAAIVGQHAQLVTTNGLFRPFAMVGGRAVGTWSITNRRVHLQLLEPIGDADQTALLADATDVERFFGWEKRSSAAPSSG